MNGNYQIGDVVFGNWVIKEKIGEGSFGKVFGIERNDFGHTYKAALKVITVPQNEAELQMALDEGMDEEDLTQHFYSAVEEIVQEFYLMSKVKGSSHVVGYEDHTVIPHTQGVGWDILIRMERLTPLLTWAFEHPMSRRDIIQLGIHMCSALELCQKHQILHRDIKPENIFVSDSGDYKLGDFGVARTMEKTMSGMSKKGTYNYMAPEVYKGEEYGFRADMYSVGIVLYRLLNHNRIPFLPPAPERVTMRDRENALNRRIQGEELPLPCYAQDTLGQMVCKAAAPVPADRYESPAQMRKVLEDMLLQEKDDTPVYPDSKEQKKRQEASKSVERSVNTSATPNMSVTPNMSDIQRNASAPKRQAVPQQSATEVEVWEDETEKTSSAFDPRRKDPGKSIKMPEGKDVKKSQPKVEEDDDKTVSAFAATKKKSVAANTAVKPAKKKSPLPLILIALVAVIGVVAVFALGGGASSQQQGGDSDLNQEDMQEQVMAMTLHDYISFWWGSYHNALKMPENEILDYTAAASDDIANVLVSTGFDHISRDCFLNEAYGLRLFVTDDPNPKFRELIFETWEMESATAGQTYYEAQRAQNEGVVLPEVLCLNETTASELGFNEEVIEWLTRDWGKFIEIEETWKMLCMVDEYDGEKSLTIDLENMQDSSMKLYLGFAESSQGWILSYVQANIELDK